jgi:hypothetical protein
MPPKKGTIAAGKQPEQRTQETPSPPPTVLKHSNSMSQARPETPQLSDISDEEALYDAETTPTTGPAEFIRFSKSSNPLLALIIFPDLPVKAKDTNLDLILQMQKQMQKQQEKQQQQMH